MRGLYGWLGSWKLDPRETVHALANLSIASFIVAGFLFTPLSNASLPSTMEVTNEISFKVGHGLVGCFIAGHSAPVI